MQFDGLPGLPPVENWACGSSGLGALSQIARADGIKRHQTALEHWDTPARNAGTRHSLTSGAELA
jgi:hypothetical protein